MRTPVVSISMIAGVTLSFIAAPDVWMFAAPYGSSTAERRGTSNKSSLIDGLNLSIFFTHRLFLSRPRQDFLR
jgi:hypothetical protein